MSMIRKIQTILVDYIKAPKLHMIHTKQTEFFKGIPEAKILDHLKEMEFKKPYKFGMFSKGDDGLKRAQFLLSKLDEWQENKLNDQQILDQICKLHVEKKEPPLGLGGAKELRNYLCLGLADALNVRKGDITDEEILAKYNQLYRYLHSEGEVFETIPEREEVIRAIMIDKAGAAMLKRVKDKDKRCAFFQGFHARLGEKSSLAGFYNDELFDMNLVGLIFDAADIQNKSKP
jgi:hypothetical protein